MSEQPQQRQYVKYTFFKVRPEWRRLPLDERRDQKQAFIDALNQSAETLVVTRAYSCVGMRADVDFLIWQVGTGLDQLQGAIAGLMATPLAGYVDITHSYVSMTKRSMYVDNHSHEGQDGARDRVRPADKRYFFVYPFVKTHDWYQLSLDERQRMMDEHIKIGHKYPRVKLNTTYSYGFDDQEFVLAFETDYPEDFLDLVMELRHAEQRPYTERDVPIFTCIAGDPADVLATLG